MSSDVSRYARIQESVAPLRSTDGTRVSSLVQRQQPRPQGSTPEELFEEKQRVMNSAVREEARPGLFVFALHRSYGLVARLWLQADETLRAGVVGRHDAVDLRLPLDGELSLRHVLFLLRVKAGQVHFVAVDLHSSGGLQVEGGARCQLVEAGGPLVLCAADYVFFCLPTGAGTGWDPRQPPSLTSLMKSSLLRLVQPRQPLCLEAGEAGRIEGDRLGSWAVGPRTLARGVQLGRDRRCEVQFHEDNVSRVHALLLLLDEQLLLIDCGSLNGTWLAEEEVFVAPLKDGDRFELGANVALTWQAAH